MLSALPASGCLRAAAGRGSAAAGTTEPGAIGQQRECGLLRSPLHGIGEGLVKARIHSQVLSFIFPCASRYKVGKPTNYAGSGPVAVRNQIDAYSGQLVGLLMMLTYILVLVLISPWLLLVVAAMRGMAIFLQDKFLPRIAAGSRQLIQPRPM